MNIVHNGTATSIAAARALAPRVGTIRERVYQYILNEGVHGATADEVEDALKMSGNTVRPRILELRKSEHLFDSQLTRPTKSGQQAVVWSAMTERIHD